MKRFLFFVLSLILVFSFVVPAFADTDLDPIEQTVDPFVNNNQTDNSSLIDIAHDLGALESQVSAITDTLTTVTDQITDLTNQLADRDPVSSVQDDTADDNPNLGPIVDAQVLTAVNPVTSSNGLKGVLLDLLGDYDAIIVEYRYQNGSNYSYVREIQPDYVWLCSCGLFVVVVYCTFKAGGALLCKL